MGVCVFSQHIMLHSCTEPRLPTQPLHTPELRAPVREALQAPSPPEPSPQPSPCRSRRERGRCIARQAVRTWCSQNSPPCCTTSSTICRRRIQGSMGVSHIHQESPLGGHTQALGEEALAFIWPLWKRTSCLLLTCFTSPRRAAVSFSTASPASLVSVLAAGKGAYYLVACDAMPCHACCGPRNSGKSLPRRCQ